MPEITFSVIMCVNRSQPWLAEAINSVLLQDDPHFEFLIAANACSDALWGELKGFQDRDRRIRLFRSDVGQLAFNLNMLADQAKGEYLVRMDADDVSEPFRLRKIREALSAEIVDILGSAVVLIDENGMSVGRMDFPVTTQEILRLLPKRTAFCHPSVAIRRRFLLDVRGYVGGLASEDTDLWLRARRAGARMRNLPEPLFRYRVHSLQSIASRAGYAEVAGHWLREFLLSPCFFSFKGLTFALSKAIFARLLPGIRHYKG